MPSKVYNEDLHGLSTPVLGQQVSFRKFDWLAGAAGFCYYQILHTAADHWITIKLISDHEVEVYDSVFLEPNYYTLKKIASTAQCKTSTRHQGYKFNEILLIVVCMQLPF